jgi:excisionase family DNA binding protein
MGTMTDDDDEDRILTTAEAADLLGVTVRTVQRKANTGQIPIVRKIPGGRHGEYLFRESDLVTDDAPVTGSD